VYQEEKTKCQFKGSAVNDMSARAYVTGTVIMCLNLLAKKRSIK